MRVAFDTELTLLGLVSDPDGLDTVSRVTWTSNIDGLLAESTGAELDAGFTRVTVRLSSGTHQITLEAFTETFQFDADEGFKLEDNEAFNMIMDTGDWMKDVGVIGCLDGGTLRAVEGHVTVTNECDNALDTLSNSVPDSASLHVE